MVSLTQHSYNLNTAPWFSGPTETHMAYLHVVFQIAPVLVARSLFKLNKIISSQILRR